MYFVSGRINEIQCSGLIRKYTLTDVRMCFNWKPDKLNFVANYYKAGLYIVYEPQTFNCFMIPINAETDILKEMFKKKDNEKSNQYTRKK